jgi:hypothetical protein
MAVKVNNPKKANPEPLEVDAYSVDGNVVLCIGDQEITLTPKDAQELADVISEAAEDAAAGIDTVDEEEEEGIEMEGED